MSRIFKAIACFLAFALLAACGQKEPINEIPDQPQGYAQLLTAYQAGYVYQSARKSGDATTIFFTNGRDIEVTGFRIHDCTSSKPSYVGLSKESGMWVIDGQLCGIRDHSYLPDEQAVPVYAYYDNTLHIYVSNGTVIEFERDHSNDPRKFTMPAVRVNTDGGAQIKDTENYVPGTASFEDPDKVYSDVSILQCRTQIRGRGNSTWGMPKKPYKIQLDEKNEVFGLDKNKSWCVLANYADKSLLRNMVGMEISRIMEFSWTPQMFNVEFYLNGRYQGVYTFSQHKKVDKNRVNIDTKNEGYYLEIEQSIDEPCYFWTSKGLPILFKDPDNPTQEQQKYIKDYFNSFEAALFGPDFKDPVDGYRKYIDMKSFVDNYIIQELAKNIDGNTRKSSALTKEKGKKLEFYHVWDFDLSFGNADYFDGSVGNGPYGWWIKDFGPNGRGSGWYPRLMQDPSFVKAVQNRWNELLPQLRTIPAFIDRTAAEMGDAPARNFNTWKILSIYVWPNVKVTGSYDAEVEYLKEFYTQRLEWLDKQINAL